MQNAYARASACLHDRITRRFLVVCKKFVKTGCKLYAAEDHIVWKE